MPKHSPQVLELAKRGAEVRLRELMQEIKMLTMAFPHLRDAFDKDELPISFIVRKGAGRPASPVRQRTISPEGRAKIAAAQKARWAKQKAEGRKK